MSEDTALVITVNTTALDQRQADPFAGLINAWLDEKSQAGSAATPAIYRKNIDSFRAALQAAGLDLDSFTNEVAAAAQAWAGARSANSKRPGKASPSTINQRYAIVSSFYEYAMRMTSLVAKNPIDLIKRPKVEAYDSAEPIPTLTVEQAMKRIDRSKASGLRDYALLSVALTTGRRLSAVAGLRWRDLKLAGDVVTLTFHEKRGKTMRSELALAVSRALMNWLYSFYGAALGDLAPDAPIWVSLDNRTRGTALGIQSITDIAEKRVGTSKFHALRHTFAQSMIDRDASLLEVQIQLGHDDPKTTMTYIKKLKSTKNKYAAGIAADFGIE